MTTRTHYVVIRRDLTFGEYSAQLAHAGEAYYLLGLQAPPEFVLDTTIAVVKGARNEARLLKLEAALLAAYVPHVAIREETGEKGGRIAGQLTCLSLMPTEREKVEPFVREFHTIDKLDGPRVQAPASPLPLPSIVDGHPRRCRVDLATPAENAIREALLEVESVGADVLLTEAVVLLDQARDKVAAFLERTPA